MPRRKRGRSGVKGEAGREASPPAKVARRTRKKYKGPSPEEIEEGIVSVKTVEWDPLTVFPKEIWAMIFERIEDPKDQHNFLNAHPTFYGMYQSKLPTILYPQVFKVFADNHVGQPDFIKSLFRLFGGQIEGDELDQTDFLNSRLVCRSWDQTVKDYVQLHPSKFDLDCVEQIWPKGKVIRKHVDDDHWRVSKHFGWWSVEELQSDLEMFSLSHPPEKNPFLTRELILHDVQEQCPCCAREEVVEPEVVQSWWRQVTALLQSYGEHVWHLKLRLLWKLNPQIYSQVEEWLRLMPNLKTMSINYDNSHRRGMNSKQRKELDAYAAMNPLPELKKLQLLKVNGVPPQLFNNLIGNLPKLEKLQIRFQSGKEFRLSEYQINLIQTGSLKEAILTLKGIDDFNYLANINPWPLSKLTMTLEFENERIDRAFSKWPDWKNIFQLVTTKFPDLEDLSLRLPKAVKATDKKKINQDNLDYRLNLPKLKFIHVVLPNLSCLDFILPSAANLMGIEVILEHLEWKSEESKALGKKEIIKINRDLKTMWKSNVWDLFPKLEGLKICALIKKPHPLAHIFGGIGDEGINEYMYFKKGKVYHEKVASDSPWGLSERGRPGVRRSRRLRETRRR